VVVVVVVVVVVQVVVLAQAVEDIELIFQDLEHL
tara:strand:+ start:39 stop:140 length:102 start_codon:yes stop_codon:yes gene_type:complete